MADLPISKLPQANTITGGEIIPLDQAGQTRQTTVSNLFNALSYNVQRTTVTATANQTLIPLTFTYTQNVNGLLVMVNGSTLQSGQDYSEISTSSILLNFALTAGDNVTVLSGNIVPPGSIGTPGTSLVQTVLYATAGQTVFNVGFNYTQGINALSVFMNGVKLVSGSDYLESSTTTITIPSGCIVTDVVEIDGYQTVTSGGIGATNVGYVPPFSGLNATTVAGKLGESVSVLDFGASTGNTAAANATAFQSALNYANSIGGCVVKVPKGTYLLNATLNIYKKTILQGEGRAASILSFSQVGDGIDSTWPINSSTAAWIGIRDLGMVNTSGASTGGGFVDVGGTFVDLFNVYLSGWKNGIIFDQTEIATITQSEFTNNTNSSIWLVNGADHTVGALQNFTNRITIKNCQINESSSVYGVIDDGGVMHSIVDNNFNGCLQHIRVAGISGLTISSNEFELGTSTSITVQATTKAGTTTLTTPIALEIRDNVIVQVTGQYAIDFVLCGSATLIGNVFSNASVASVHITNLTSLVSLNNYNTGGYSGTATYSTIRDTYYAGAVVLQSSTGISFGNIGTASTGTVVNGVLNNYEEGTWTPSLVPVTSGSITLTAPTNSMSYTRVGNRVHFSGQIVVTSVSSPLGDLRISGLPFSINNTNNGNGAFSVMAAALLNSPAHTALQGFAPQNSAYLYIRGYYNGGQIVNMAANVQAGTTIMISGSYQV